VVHDDRNGTRPRSPAMRLTQFLVVNMPLFGPGLRVAPSADPSDGLLDVVALDVIPFERLPS